MYRKIAFLLAHLIVISQSIDPACFGYTNVRSYDGFCNNLNNPYWGNANTPERRMGAPNYQDGLSIPIDGPNPRTVSQTFFALPPQINDVNKTFYDREFGADPGHRNLNMFAVLSLQFLTHDMAFTPLLFNPVDETVNFEIPIPNCTAATSTLLDELCIWPTPGDPNANPFPMDVLFTRLSQFTTVDGVYTPMTNVSGFIDLSNVYGSYPDINSDVRSHVNGQLKVGNNGEALPRAIDIGTPNDCGPFVTDGSGAGDSRVDENTGITTLHVAFLRLHNSICEGLMEIGYSSNDEVLFQKARDLTIGIWQHIVFDELLPTVFGSLYSSYMPPYTGYNVNTNPSIQLEGTTAGFRFHNLLNLPFLHVNTSCELVQGVIAVHLNIPVKVEEQDNCHPERFRQVGPEIVLRGLLIQYAQNFDGNVTDGIRNLRLDFAPGNVDVASADIYRSRLHGVPDYNSIRVLYGLDSVYSHCTEGTTTDPLACFEYITSNHTLATLLMNTYKKVNKIDPLVGIHAENIYSGSAVSHTAAAIELSQLKAIRDGDRFFWRAHLNFLDQLFVESFSMADVLAIAFPTLAAELSPTAFDVNTHHHCYMPKHH